MAKPEAVTEFEKFRELTRYQPSTVEIHFIEAFEAVQKKFLKRNKIKREIQLNFPLRMFSQRTNPYCDSLDYIFASQR